VQARTARIRAPCKKGDSLVGRARGGRCTSSRPSRTLLARRSRTSWRYVPQLYAAPLLVATSEPVAVVGRCSFLRFLTRRRTLFTFSRGICEAEFRRRYMNISKALQASRSLRRKQMHFAREGAEARGRPGNVVDVRGMSFVSLLPWAWASRSDGPAEALGILRRNVVCVLDGCSPYLCPSSSSRAAWATPACSVRSPSSTFR
jgi:hypothetical protein